jgi:hypothetical protein
MQVGGLLAVADSRRRWRTLPGTSSALGRTRVSIEEHALVSLVGTAAELNVLHRGLAPHAVRVDVMEFEKIRSAQR